MGNLVLEGNIGIQRIKAIWTDAGKLLKKKKGIALDLRRVTDCDTSFIQLLYALAASCARDNVPLETTGEVAAVIEEKCMMAGFLPRDYSPGGDFLGSLHDLPGGVAND